MGSRNSIESGDDIGYPANFQYKITPPAVSPFEINREFIAAKAIGDHPVRLVLVHGPAGFGKTTVLSQIRHHLIGKGVLTTWLTLDESDNDLSRFLQSLDAALDQIKPESRASAPATEDNSDTALRIMSRINQFQVPIAAFFDEFEVLYNPVVIKLIASRIEMLPPNSCLVMASRSLPDIGLPRLRARGQLVEIDAEQLRFSASETQQFFRQHNRSVLSPDELEKMRKTTEGWAAALRLASLALERHADPNKLLEAFTGKNKAIAEYMAEDVLAGLSGTLRNFLLNTSVLNELTPELCDQVCGRHDSAEMLDQLLKKNLFLNQLDFDSPRFRYHGLFRDFLRNQLRSKHPGKWADLNLAAALAYETIGRNIPAVQHALQSADRAYAISLLTRNTDQLLLEGRMRLLQSVLANLTAEEMESHPILKVIQAWCTTFVLGPKQGLEMISGLDAGKLPADARAYLNALRPLLLAMMDRVEEAHAAGCNALADMSLDYPFASAMLYQSLAQSGIILGDHANAYRYMDAARQAQQRGTGILEFVLTESAEALLDMMSGRLKQAAVRTAPVQRPLPAGSNHQPLGNPLAAIEHAETLYETGDCSGAENLLRVYCPLVQDLGPADALISAYVMLARIQNAQGERDRALNSLQELETCGHRLDLNRIIASARLERANHYLCYDDLSGAQRQLALAEQTIDWQLIAQRWYVSNDTLIPIVIHSRLEIRSGKVARILPELKSAIAAAEHQGRLRRAIKLRILESAAKYADGQHKQAQRALYKVVEMAQREGFVQTFIEEKNLIQPMLGNLLAERRKDLDKSWLEGVQLGTQLPQAPGKHKDMVEPLTPKELAVLQLLAQGLSNNDMADKLFVSESTVRTHLRNINLKLQAKNRTQAVIIARELDLIA
jgi:ATP/maltotriose-dependent transcriptional regulator MalT